MSFSNISNVVLERITGLPSRSIFLKHRVVPAKDDDKFNTNKCAQCWDEYTDEHPGVKISACGHVFGRDCLEAIIDGPAGDLCPYCRVKLFRRAPAMRNILESALMTVLVPLTIMLIQSFGAYWKIVKRLNKKINAFLTANTAQHPWLCVPVDLLFDGIAPWASKLVRNRTDICARNPHLKIDKFFDSLTIARQLLFLGFPYIAPSLLPVYFMFGPTAYKISFFAVNLAVTSYVQALCVYYIYHPDEYAGVWGGFDDKSDRDLCTYIAAVVIVFQQLCIITMLWPMSTVGFAWSVVASVAWR